MASIVVNQGLQRIGDTASQTAGYAAARFIRTMSVDIGATLAFAAAHTKLNDSSDVGATVNTHYFDQALSTPTRSAQTVSHFTTIGTTDGNFTIKRIALHDDTAANVTNSSTTLVCGVDGQTLAKTADFTMTPTLALLFSSV